MCFDVLVSDSRKKSMVRWPNDGEDLYEWLVDESKRRGVSLNNLVNTACRWFRKQMEAV